MYPSSGEYWALLYKLCDINDRSEGEITPVEFDENNRFSLTEDALIELFRSIRAGDCDMSDGICFLYMKQERDAFPSEDIETRLLNHLRR